MVVLQEQRDALSKNKDSRCRDRSSGRSPSLPRFVDSDIEMSCDEDLQSPTGSEEDIQMLDVKERFKNEARIIIVARHAEHHRVKGRRSADHQSNVVSISSSLRGLDYTQQKTENTEE